jgi:hypothetical protein
MWSRLFTRQYARASALALVCAAALPAAAQVFDVTIRDVSRPDLPAFRNTFDTSSATLAAGNEQTLVKIFPGYSNQDRVEFSANYRGLPVSLVFPEGRTSINLSIPGCNQFARSFDGGSRDASNNQIREFFKQDQGELNGIMRCLAAESSADPPSRLVDTMLKDTWFTDVIEPNSTQRATPAGEKAGRGSVGLNVGISRVGEVNVKDFSLPFSYGFSLANDKTLTLGAVLTQTNFEGSRSYSVAPRIALKVPVRPAWTLAATAAYGTAVSKDLGSAGQMVSASLTNTYTWRLGKFDLTAGNLLGYFRSLPINRYGYRFDPELRSTVLKNGALFVQPLETRLAGTRLSVEYFVTDTRFFGTNLFVDQYNEIGFSIGSDKRSAGVEKLLRAGITFTVGPHLTGGTLNLGYKF